MNNEMIIEKLEADAMKTVAGGDMRSISSGWEGSANEGGDGGNP